MTSSSLQGLFGIAALTALLLGAASPAEARPRGALPPQPPPHFGAIADRGRFGRIVRRERQREVHEALEDSAYFSDIDRGRRYAPPPPPPNSFRRMRRRWR